MRRRCASSATYWRSTSWAARIFERVQEHLQERGAADRDGNDRGCDDCARSEFDQERGARSAIRRRTRRARGSSGTSGMKAHVGVDSKSKLIHAVVATPANVADACGAAGFAARRRDARVGRSSVSRDRGRVLEECAPRAQDFPPASATAIRIGWMKWSAPRTARRRRCGRKAEYVFAVMKLKFGFVKVRYRGIAKNANRLFATCALVNLFLARKTLLGMTAAKRVPKPPHRSHGADAPGSLYLLSCIKMLDAFTSGAERLQSESLFRRSLSSQLGRSAVCINLSVNTTVRLNFRAVDLTH